MIAPRWRKVIGDLRAQAGRIAAMTAAIAAGVFGVGTMLVAYTILSREIARSYASSRPASATLELASVGPELVDAVRRRPEIADAEARATLLVRVRVGYDWLPLLLFVIDDFSDVRLNRFNRETGAGPPPAGTVLLERSALAMLETDSGASLRIKTPSAAVHDLAIAGLVHDPGLAPAWQERTGYGYITRETLRGLGEPPVLDELRILVADASADRTAIETTVRALARWLQGEGQAVKQIQLPPPRRHPHQGQMEAVLISFIGFSALALMLAAILVATVLAGMLAGQVREIGVMKTLGARTAQMAGMYFVMIVAIGAIATAVAMPASVFAGRQLSGAIAALLNFERVSQQVPAWVFVVQIAAGVLVPLVFAALPILRGVRATVRDALNDHGVKAADFGRDWLERWLAAHSSRNRLRSLAWRNLLRRRGRLGLSLGLLAAAGGTFMAATNVRRAWQAMVARVYTERAYDVEIRLHRPEREEKLRAALRDVPGLRAIETWGYATAAFARDGEIDVVRTYPDGGHGSFAFLGVPDGTPMVRFPILAGRWLQPDDRDGVVLNHMARAQQPGLAPGDRVELSLDGRPTSWRVVGIVEEVGAPAAAYVTASAFASASAAPGHVKMLRIASSAIDPAARADVIRAIESALDQAGVSVRLGLPLAELRTAMGDHVLVLTRTLLAVAALNALIGLLGLASTMSMNVVERTRELGVMKAIGARPRTIISLIVQEGLFVALLSCVCALPAAALLSAAVGRLVGTLAFRLPLALSFSWGAAGLWGVVSLGLAVCACALPAWRGARLTVREALAYS